MNLLELSEIFRVMIDLFQVQYEQIEDLKKELKKK